MSESDREKWNSKYAQRISSSNAAPDDWLIECGQSINQLVADDQPSNRAIDIACGLGQNSIWLAQHGWKVDGVDVSSVGLAFAEKQATYSDCAITWLEADLDNWLPAENSYDLAIVFRFLDRLTIPKIVNHGLKSGCWLIYETFAAGQLDRSGSHIQNPAFTLSPGELPILFPDFDIIEFREDSLKDREVQRLFARKK